MTWFLAHLIFSFLWAALLGAYDFLTFLSGFAIGFFLLRITLSEPTRNYRRRITAILRFAIFYLKEILQSNLRIALDVIRGKPRIQPGIVAVDVAPLTERGAVIVANLITMTPGTLSLDLSEDGRLLYVHCLYLDNPGEMRDSLEKDYVGSVAAFHEKI